MRCALIAIGNELLSGRVVNTNGAFLAKELDQLGFSGTQHSALPDEEKIVQKAVQEALEQVDLVIVTGGLGSTLDDVTKQAVAHLFDVSFQYNAEVKEDLVKRYGERGRLLEGYSLVPEGAQVLLNPVGAAPGLVFHRGNALLILLPGVPHEAQELFKQRVVPYLHRHFGTLAKQFQEAVFFCKLSENVVDPLLRELSREFPQLSFGIYPFHATLRVEIKGRDQREIFLAKQRLVARFSLHVYESVDGTIERAIHQLFIDQKKTLAIAESCTGGKIAERLTSIGGASTYFLGSIVCYSDAMKQNILGVSEATLRAHGAVSREVVQEMLKGLFEKTEADVALAISGIAGPTGGSPSKPIGTIWLAFGERGGKSYSATFQAFGDRYNIIFWGANVALGALYCAVAYGKNLFSGEALYTQTT